MSHGSAVTVTPYPESGCDLRVNPADSLNVVGHTTRHDDIPCTPAQHSTPGTKTCNVKATVWDFNNWSQNADMLVSYAQELAKIDLRGFQRPVKNVKSAAANGATGAPSHPPSERHLLPLQAMDNVGVFLAYD
jgi:hypothetical protein